MGAAQRRMGARDMSWRGHGLSLSDTIRSVQQPCFRQRRRLYLTANLPDEILPTLAVPTPVTRDPA